jgi:molybdenum cofactor synthesis domain-containing protein
MQCRKGQSAGGDMPDDSRSYMKTAAIIIIGNEILSGKVCDTNSFFLASELRSLGVNVVRICVIPDDIETIGAEAASCSSRYDYVFTSGGVGPTHDDVTMAGIANGFGVRLVANPALEDRFRRRYGKELNAAVMKMAQVPEGTEIIDLGNARFPLACFRNIFIFPGIPEYLKEKFGLIRDRFRSGAFYLRRIFVNAEESDIAAVLNQAVAEHSDVAFGSYPILGNDRYKIIITAESRSAASVDRAAEQLIARLPENVICSVE